ncbi:MAG TPA: efflux RND transporter permease subunit [bacterium]|jgi:CzcA family heavy metal efflux pump
MWLTRLALRYPITTFLLACTIMVLGLVSFTQLRIDLLPDITIPVVSVITFYTGAGPLDMEQTVTTFIERGVSSTNNVTYVQSSTKEGISQVRINFDWGANLDVALVDVIQRVNRIFNQLPAGVSTPIALRFDITSVPVCVIAVSGGGMDERDLYDLAFNTIEPQIEHLSGVASASVTGGRIREIHITLDRDRLEALQLPVADVLTAVANANVTIPSGDLKTGPFDYSLKTESRFNVVAPMSEIIIKNVNNVPIRIKDVARVEDSYQEQTELIRINGTPGLTLSVQKLANANTVNVVDNVMKALPHLADVPQQVKMTISFDQSQYIRQTISGLQREAMMGAALAIILILLFLRNIRATTIILVAIPLSILVTFIFFRFSNVTLNIMTFGGLALAVGRLVDDSIVELEAITRHYNLRRPNETRLQATLGAAQEVASPIFVSTLTTVIVFLPIVFLTGIAKMLFVPLTMTIAVALFGSFFVSRTVTPLMCLQFLRPEKELNRESRRLSDRIRVRAHDALEGIDSFYERQLQGVLRHKGFVILAVAILGALSFGLAPFIGTEFFPEQDEGQFTVTVKLPVGTRSDVTIQTVQQIEKILQDNIPEVQSVISDIGVPQARSGSLFSRNSGTHAANIRVGLIPENKRKRSVWQIVNVVRPKISTIPGASIYIATGGFLKFLMNFGSSAPIDVEVRGFDLATGSRLAKQIQDLVRSVPGATDVQISREDNLPELRVRIDRDKAGILGINASQIANTVNTSIAGAVASLYTDPVTGNQYNILVRFGEDFRSHVADLENIVLSTTSGQPVRLGNVAVVELASSPVQIDRKYQQRLVEVTANVSGRDLGSVAKDIQAKIDKLDLPPGFQVVQTGNVEQQKSTFKALTMAFALAILLVYVVMASQFQSLIDPFIIMFTVPLGLVGVLWMLFLTHTTLSVTSFQGIIVMVGIVVSNGILLVDYTNHLRLRNPDIALRDAVTQAGRTRLKPILMTSLATVFGLLPMALALGGEANQQPLAIAVIGGLSVSTVLTLFFVPALYTTFEERFKRELRKEEV